jgi:hypothetical protein
MVWTFLHNISAGGVIKGEVVQFQSRQREATMTTPANDNKNNSGDQQEPKHKGGVVGTDAKDFDDSDPFGKPPKQGQDAPTHSETK